MTEVKTLKIDQKFNGTEDLYRYLLKNTEFIGDSIGIQIQKPLKSKLHCVIGNEKITERNILFFATKSEFTESLGELITLASVFDANIIIFFIKNARINYFRCVNWLQNICNDDTQFFIGEVLS